MLNWSWMEIAVWAVCLLPIWGALFWHAWELSLRPRLIPAADIKALADEIVSEYGPRAEEIAFAEEDRAWRYSETLEQGKWRRVRRELWRRYEAGEWSGPQGLTGEKGLFKAIQMACGAAFVSSAEFKCRSIH